MSNIRPLRALMSELLPLLSPKLTRREARAVLRNGITLPLFIPDLGVRIVTILVDGDSQELLASELNRLALLGSDNAAALLTFLHTRAALDGGQYAATALERCQASAA